MKILAVVSMLIDHTAIFLFPRFIDGSVYMVMFWSRTSIAFPKGMRWW